MKSFGLSNRIIRTPAQEESVQHGTGHHEGTAHALDKMVIIGIISHEEKPDQQGGL